ncbi:MAG: hypothetical protein GF404_01225 [candidate division Zixibacteria bacterium]|jgi:anti-sigma28 factor (negative regulator of flagellin synthesis)|nr:hypothetical protein [candidate division Zixibacteria bacterium]
MKINDDNFMKSVWSSESFGRGNRKMSDDTEQERKMDQVELNGKLVSKAMKEPEVRKQKVAEVKQKVAEGVYNDPEVVDEIVDRLIDQFGI